MLLQPECLSLSDTGARLSAPSYGSHPSLHSSTTRYKRVRSSFFIPPRILSTTFVALCVSLRISIHLGPRCTLSAQTTSQTSYSFDRCPGHLAYVREYTLGYMNVPMRRTSPYLLFWLNHHLRGAKSRVFVLLKILREGVEVRCINDRVNNI